MTQNLSGQLTGDDGSIWDVTMSKHAASSVNLTVALGTPEGNVSTGGTLTFLSSVSPSNAAGVVRLSVNGTQVAQQALSSGSATLTYTIPSTPGTYACVVSFVPDDAALYLPASSPTFTYTASAQQAAVPDSITFGTGSGSRVHVVNGVNRTRLQDETILYSGSYGPNTATNKYCVELKVEPNTSGVRVVTVKDNRGSSNNPAMTIPAAPGFVVSMHGASADWAVTNVAEGDVVSLTASGVLTWWPGASAPPTLPAAPTGLTATVTGTSVALAWTAVAGATSYRVYRDGSTTPVGAPSGASFTDASGTAGSTYSYRVSAVNGAGEGPLSASASATIPVGGGGAAQLYLGASGHGTASGSMRTWMTHPEAFRITAIWSDTDGHDPAHFSELSGDYGSWNGPIDVAVGALRDGQNWASAASGAYDSQWTQRFGYLKTAWGSRPAGNLRVRIAHEFNGDFSDYAVSDSNCANFVSAFRRWSDIARSVIPGCKITYSPNDGTSSLTHIIDTWPGSTYVDFIGVDSYNKWPWRSSASSIQAAFTATDGNGNPVGIEAWRQWAAARGKPMYLSETGNPSINADEGGGGDAPAYFTSVYSWATAHAGNGAGNVDALIWFNFGVDDGYPSHYQFFTGTAADSHQPNFAAAFRAATLVG